MATTQRSESDAFTRRGVLTSIAALGAVAATGAASAQQQDAGAKGPRVWLDLDQKALDEAYDQSKYAPNLQQIIKRYATNSEATRRRIGQPKRVAYGSTPIEMLDIYATRRAGAPVNVYIHGGAWRSGLAKDYAFPAEMFNSAGAHYVVLDFINVLEAGGNLMPMAEQVRRGVAWVYKNAASFGGDPNRVFVSGFSSGAHLAGVVLITDWQEFGVPADVVKGAVLCSGMYDLKPVRLSARSNYVKFTDEMEDRLSTQRYLSRINCPVTVAHGTLETPEFQRQTRDFAAAMKAAGKPIQFLIGEGYNHFEMMETLANPHGLLGRAALEQMKLTTACL
jgi:arylformamidase